MKIITNPDKEYAKEIRERIKDNNGFCPCRINKTEDTKCMCKEFRDMVANGITGECHCGLYISTE